MPCILRVAENWAAQQNAAVDENVITAQEGAPQWEHDMAIHGSVVAAISAAVTAAARRQAAAAREMHEAEAAGREVAAACEAREAREEAELRALEAALAQDRARKEAEGKAQGDAVKKEAIETARWKVAEEKPTTEVVIGALEAEKA